MNTLPDGGLQPVLGPSLTLAAWEPAPVRVLRDAESEGEGPGLTAQPNAECSTNWSKVSQSSVLGAKWEQHLVMSFSFISHSLAELDELIFLLGVSRVREGFSGRGCLNSLRVIKRGLPDDKGWEGSPGQKNKMSKSRRNILSYEIRSALKVVHTLLFKDFQRNSQIKKKKKRCSDICLLIQECAPESGTGLILLPLSLQGISWR